MNKLIYALRSLINNLLYRWIVRPIIFLWEAEKAHNKLKQFGLLFASNKFGRGVLKALFYYQHSSLNTTVDGIKYDNPIGLSAGFDKDGELTDAYPSIGFGFAELGSFTGDRCAGNPGVGRRLFRLIKSKSILVWYGLNNQGAVAIAKRLKSKKFSIPIGINAAKTNDSDYFDLQTSIDDYLKTLGEFKDIGSYYTINISCPNTQDGEPFVERENLDALLSALDKVKQACKPVYVKMAADLTTDEINTIVDTCLEHKVNGLVLTNLTKPSMSGEYFKEELTFDKGALSGLPVQRISINMIRHVYQRTHGEITIIGVGGVFNAQDAYEKITAGANLVEVITGLIFEGPQVIGEINRGLVELLKKDGFSSIEEAVGSRNLLK
ncbi:MAG: quinone-dependent dihydroorotate dehydrogenase [Gammaproteobacteria bacterium]|nr:quinone-dependent dihydroorotate dehydrogenase [Gammaproteobacteria bacterium]